MYDAISKNPDDIDSYTVEFQSLHGLDKLDEKAEEFKKYIFELNGEISNIYLDSNNSIFNVRISNDKISKIIDAVDSISKVSKIPTKKLNKLKTSKKLDFFETKEIKIDEKGPLETILIIDSGINSAHYKIDNQLIGTYDFLTEDFIPCNDTLGHGTNVAGFAVYGESPQDEYTPSANIIMMKNYDSNLGFIVDDIQSLERAIELFTNEFSIINLSYSADEVNPSLSKIIDKISFNSNKLIITSAGNIELEHIEHYINTGVNYPNYISNYPIFFPGDGRNIVTVGSSTTKKSNICDINTPSPFTRYGADPLIVKPDLIMSGGNLSNQITTKGVSISSEGLGLTTVSHENDYGFCEKHGTSFSAPIIANLFARLKSMTGIDSNAMLKALLFSACSRLTDNSGKYYDEKIQGFGRPNFDNALYSNIYRVNYIMEGEFNSRYYDVFDRYNFWFPIGANKFEVTLVCEKSNTFYSLEKDDYIEFKIYHRGGTGGSTKLKPILGKEECITTYKGEYEIESGSRGIWMVDIVPNFSTKNLYPLDMKYGCVITISDLNNTNDIWQDIYDKWLRDIIHSQEIILEPEILEKPITISQ